ncbi:MAG: hypothetical protein R3286_11830, partial [Gammaproteobacteria bacterium]|nr:hypothetical protein [Gammaproteobacteria bacterium]
MDDLELIELWPTLILSQPLPRHEAHTERLAALAREHAGEGVFAVADASVDWLKTHVAHGVNAYLARCAIGSGAEWGARGWFEVLGFGDYRGLRERPEAALCGMYVLRGADDADVAGRRDDLRPGALTFFDPRPAMNKNAINGDPYQRYHETLRPVAGLLLIWPGHVRCFAHPNLGRD